MIYAIIILIIIFIGLLISGYSNKLILNYYNKISNISTEKFLNTFFVLNFFIEKLNLNVKIIEYSEGLNNSYNVKTKTIYLSKDVINSNSVASVAISMHELGHAIQHQKKSGLFFLFRFLTILNKLTSVFLVPSLIFLIVSLFLTINIMNIAIIISLSIYLINLLSRLILIPVEKNASKIAINLLKEHKLLTKKELKQAKNLLNLALLTYIGGLFYNIKKFFNNIMKGF